MAEIGVIISKLLERTRENKVPWVPTAVEQTFLAVIGDLSVTITIDNADDFIIKVHNKQGREIAALDSGYAHDWEDDLSELHSMARRVALDVDDQLDQLLERLESGRIDDLPF